MVVRPIACKVRTFALAVTMTIIGATGPGCAAVNQCFSGLYSGALIRAEHKHELADVRQDTREELAKQRQEALRKTSEHELQLARIEAENLRLQEQFCQANQEALQRLIKSNVRDQVETKMSFNVVQGLEAGELEVDMPELEALMKKRADENQREQENLKNPPTQPPCTCCDQPCGCEPGMIRRLCPKCRHRGCEAEEKCGGPEALRRITQEPLKRPLRPTEIPLKLPVKLSFGMNGPEMEAARISRIPITNEQEPLKRTCDRCGKCNANPGCDCHLHGATSTRRLPPPPAPERDVLVPPVNVDFLEPPKPTPDDTTRNGPARLQRPNQSYSTQFVQPTSGVRAPNVRVAPGDLR